MHKLIRGFVGGLAITGMTATMSWAVPVDAAQSYVDDMAQAAMTVLQSPEDRAVKFARLLWQGVDFQAVTRGALGSQARGIGDRKLAELSRLVAIEVAGFTIEKLNAHPVSGYAIDGFKTLPNGDVLVSARLFVAGGGAVATGWLVNDRGGRPRIVDVRFEGYSLRISLGETFRRKLKFGGIDGLINSYRARFGDRSAI